MLGYRICGEGGVEYTGNKQSALVHLVLLDF